MNKILNFKLLLLLLLVLLAGCSSAKVDSSPAEREVSRPAATTAPATAAPVASQGDSLPAAQQAGDVVKLAPASAPKIGKITFAQGATEMTEPLEAGVLFSQGITEIHAIFDYSGLTPASTWERVWYLNDQEVGRSVSAWTGPESGRFDYFIQNNGKPLPAGDWMLELYVDGKLRAVGAFIVEPAEGAGM